MVLLADDGDAGKQKTHRRIQRWVVNYSFVNGSTSNRQSASDTGLARPLGVRRRRINFGNDRGH
jgi:hypothetical protein